MADQQLVSQSRLDLATVAGRGVAALRDRLGASDAETAGGRFLYTQIMVVLCQLADLITFNMAVERYGPSGEVGPLGIVYRAGGFWAVALVKILVIGTVMAVLTRYPWQRLATRRRLALLIAGVGAFGALTNALAFVWLT